ncbi:MAG TPA: ammonium transporter, partial [Candidatus Omnitrophota bacterium]|nr:ammonium transporter [Candidatus Omnitrophota bacterium]
LVVLSVEFLDKVLKIDDPVGAVSVHGVCGTWGTIAVGIFAEEKFGGVNGLLHGGGFGQFFTQVLGAGSVFVWVFGTSALLFYLIKVTMGLRAGDEEQIKGLDVDEHGMEAYAGFQTFMTQ